VGSRAVSSPSSFGGSERGIRANCLITRLVTTAERRAAAPTSTQATIARIMPGVMVGFAALAVLSLRGWRSWGCRQYRPKNQRIWAACY
jgi:hypothetical protein